MYLAILLTWKAYGFVVLEPTLNPCFSNGRPSFLVLTVPSLRCFPQEEAESSQGEMGGKEIPAGKVENLKRQLFPQLYESDPLRSVDLVRYTLLLVAGC